MNAHTTRQHLKAVVAELNQRLMMEFTPISTDDFVTRHISENAGTTEIQLRSKLAAALADHQNGVRCSCGNQLWVVGSALGGNGCFSCITGEASGKDIPELEAVIKGRRLKDGRRHIDDLHPSEINGAFDDDGFEILPKMVRKPSLCMLCKLNNDPSEQVLCDLTRYECRNDVDFECARYRRG